MGLRLDALERTARQLALYRRPAIWSKMPHEFAHCGALVTGAASGIGLATARLLAVSDATPIVVTDQNVDALDRATADIGAAVRLGGNVADEGFWADAMAQISDIRLAVINAGVASGGAIETLDFHEWRRVMSVNLDGAFLTLRAAIQAMKAKGKGGSIVIVASASGLKAEQGIAAYGTSKAGALHLARIAAKECAPHGIRVNAIAPAGVKTPIWRDAAFLPNLFAKTATKKVPSRHWAKPHRRLGDSPRPRKSQPRSHSCFQRKLPQSRAPR